ncbi:glycosyltransferase family 2 protein [Patescibacteria group bacterium]|nr:glycosyltransferase family 2 protein [Patescibacteria group bacterium]MBU1722035.1 glycosyltransferase family 2 protein [Patescibacteria group bacterium]MBU1901762.1 glycosyltransferase family 2 protein [Patescibacteria group bacterium]
MLLAVVPAYNEEERIACVIKKLQDHVDHIVVIDDASKDNTVKVARLAGATVLEHKINRGQGAALETGHEYARLVGAEYILHFDGDDQMHPEDIAPALAHMKEQKALVLFGSRLLDGRSTLPWFKRMILLPIGKMINFLFVRAHLSDVHNGFRLFHAQVLAVMVIEQDRMAHATEIPAKVIALNLPYVEFPIKVTYHEYGQSARGGFTILKDLLFSKFIS